MGKKTTTSPRRFTRAIHRDRTKRPTPGPAAPAVEALLTDLVHPATLAQVAYFHQAGLRERCLTLPVMMATTVSMIWRPIPSVAEAVRTLQEDGLLWAEPLQVSPQAMTYRLGSLPAALFAQVLHDLLPVMAQRWQQRQRPLPAALRRVQAQFAGGVVALDGSTLDGVLRKTGLLRAGSGPALGGRMAALLDVLTKLPRAVWYTDDATAHDLHFWDAALTALTPGTLVLFDLGFLKYDRFDQLTAQQIGFVSRMKEKLVVRPQQVLVDHPVLRDSIIELGSLKDQPCQHRLRLIEWQQQGQWYRYLTNVLDPAVLAATDVIALYGQRWRIEIV